MTDEFKLPIGLVSSTRSGDAVPLIGSGLSQASGMASWDRIADVLSQRISETGVDLDRLEIPDLAKSIDRHSFQQLLEEAVGRGFKPNQLHYRLSEIPGRTVLTTNWDTLIESSMAEVKRVNVISDDETARQWRESQAAQVIKLHGCITSPNTIVFGLRDYSRLYDQPSVLMSLARTIIATRPIVALGFGMRDAFLKSLIMSVAPGEGRDHYVVVGAEQLDSARERYLTEIGFTVIETPTTPEDPYGLGFYLERLWEETYTEAKSRIDRTGLLVRETRRLSSYLGSDNVIRAHAALGPLAVPDENALDVFGGDDQYRVERELLDAVVELVGNSGTVLRLIVSPIDGGHHASLKGYTREAHVARLSSMIKWIDRLGERVEIVSSDRPSDVNDWIVGDLALIESRKSTLSDSGRLYHYAKLEVDPNSVSSAARRFDEEFFSLISRKGGIAESRSEFIANARREIGE